MKQLCVMNEKWWKQYLIFFGGIDEKKNAIKIFPNWVSVEVFLSIKIEDN